MAQSQQRQRSERFGRLAEWMAALVLFLKGYRILAVRARMKGGEVDLIARRGGVLAFIEVKYRPTSSLAMSAVSPAAWQRISHAAGLWAQANARAGELDWRFDLIAVSPWQWPKHLQDFWRP